MIIVKLINLKDADKDDETDRKKEIKSEKMKNIAKEYCFNSNIVLFQELVASFLKPKILPFKTRNVSR